MGRNMKKSNHKIWIVVQSHVVGDDDYGEPIAAADSVKLFRSELSAYIEACNISYVEDTLISHADPFSFDDLPATAALIEEHMFLYKTGLSERLARLIWGDAGPRSVGIESELERLKEIIIERIVECSVTVTCAEIED